MHVICEAIDRRRPSFMSLQLPRLRHPLLIVGDIICDHYVWGNVERISPEAPVQVLHWEREADRPGGAANVAMNLAALGCKVHLAGVVGKDAAGRWLLKALQARGIDTRSVIVSPHRPTTTKTRVIARGQHLLRIDRETREALDAVTERRLVSAIEKLNSTLGGTICSDYGKGVLTPSVLRAAFRRTGDRAKGAEAARPVVLVDPKGRDFGKYRGADVLTPNEKEFAEATEPDGSIEQRAKSLINRLGLKALLVTRGAEGMDLFEHDEQAARRDPSDADSGAAASRSLRRDRCRRHGGRRHGPRERRRHAVDRCCPSRQRRRRHRRWNSRHGSGGIRDAGARRRGRSVAGPVESAVARGADRAGRRLRVPTASGSS